MRECYGPTVFPPDSMCWSPDSWYGCIWRMGVTRTEWSHRVRLWARGVNIFMRRWKRTLWVSAYSGKPFRAQGGGAIPASQPGGVLSPGVSLAGSSLRHSSSRPESVRTTKPVLFCYGSSGRGRKLDNLWHHRRERQRKEQQYSGPQFNPCRPFQGLKPDSPDSPPGVMDLAGVRLFEDAHLLVTLVLYYWNNARFIFICGFAELVTVLSSVSSSPPQSHQQKTVFKCFISHATIIKKKNGDSRFLNHLGCHLRQINEVFVIKNLCWKHHFTCTLGWKTWLYTISPWREKQYLEGFFFFFFLLHFAILKCVEWS